MNLDENAINYPTLDEDIELYTKRLEALRVSRIAIEERRTRVKAAIDGIKFGTARETLQKKLTAIENKLTRIDKLISEVDLALKTKFDA